MIRMNSRSIFAATLACMAMVAYSQTAIQVEESTSTRRAAPANAPIDISIPGSRPADIRVTTSTDGESRPTETQDGRIELTPAQFRARRAQELPVDSPATPAVRIDPAVPGQTPAPAPTATPALTPETTPSPTPAPLMSTPVVPTETPEPEPVETQDADEATTDSLPTLEPAEAPEPVEMTPDDMPTTPTASSQAEAKEVDYLPPADLGKEKTIVRGAVEVPMVPELLTSSPLEMTVPDVSQTTLSNGMKFYHYESRDLPRVRVNLIVDAGQNADPADKVGLATLTARTLRSGGSAGKSADDIDEALDQIGSDLEIKVERDHISASMFILSDRLASGTQLLADILVRPDFNADKFEQQRARALEELRRQNDNPADVNRREFRKLIYGKDHELARTPTSATLAAITLDDVRKFYEAHYRPSSLWIGISGNISTDEARQLVETTFAGWDRPAGERVPVPPAINDTASSPGVYLTRKATAQSQIRLGHLGMPRRLDDAYAVNVLNSVFGTGGFSSRLMNTVRTKHGYVYGVGGGVMSDDPAGIFLAGASSKPSTTAAAIREMIGVIRQIIEGGITEAELETARRDVMFSFISEFDAPQKIVQAHMLYDFRGYAPDYLKNFPERIRAVTTEDVQAMARKYMQPDKLVIYVLGNADELDAPLDQFGPVSEWTLEEYAAQP